MFYVMLWDAFFSLRVSKSSIDPVTRNATKSAIGAANIAPSSPKNFGRMIKSGIKNKICLVKDMSAPAPALPMEVYIFATIGWNWFTNVKNR